METRTTTYGVEGGLDVIVGSLVVLDRRGGEVGHFTGANTRVWLDGREVTGVVSLTLRISFDEIVRVTIEQSVSS